VILEYHRPQTLEEALELISRKIPLTYPLGGGTLISRNVSEDYSVVDLQNLGLNKIKIHDQEITIGATATLQQVVDTRVIPEVLKTSIVKDTSYNIRQIATLAGSIVACDGRSRTAAVLMALDARLVVLPQKDYFPMDKWLLGRGQRKSGFLISEVVISSQPEVIFEAISRTPVDQPIFCVAAARWPSGRMRFVLGGFGSSPRLIYDGTNRNEVVALAEEGCTGSQDQWASEEYRKVTTRTIVKRILSGFENNQEE
jgi:CO/xanthine dehydrogenase FAD-binding subunit